MSPNENILWARNLKQHMVQVKEIPKNIYIIKFIMILLKKKKKSYLFLQT